ncbi:hypothetical protein Pint_15671 [Pistacia integerrima]|uniref:Uncharacterized protein n=1 Tax=Pistacia integerrima TaxID=434235 RepID=A0ACC0ZGK5_9ROSI|nr:hypothetical protein Pint_15671 [Pistacia integerrima]
MLTLFNTYTFSPKPKKEHQHSSAATLYHSLLINFEIQRLFLKLPSLLFTGTVSQLPLELTVIVIDYEYGGSALALPEYIIGSDSKRKWKIPFRRIRCSLMEQGLKPRPKPNKVDIEELKESKVHENQVKKPCAGLCSQIEKLVLNKKYREALELFEILELEVGFDVGSSTYDALVTSHACEMRDDD